MTDLKPSVIYRPGRPTVEDYDEAIEALVAARGQIEPDGRMCAVCHDSGHQAWECHHNPLVVAREAHFDRVYWVCFHCGLEFTQDDFEAAEEHFGKTPEDVAACLRRASSPGEAGPTCDDCGEPDRYNHWVPDEVWAQIAPKPFNGADQQGGNLCIGCIDRRCADLGLATTVRLYFEGEAVRLELSTGEIDVTALRHLLHLPPGADAEVLFDLANATRFLRTNARPKRHGKPDYDRRAATTIERIRDGIVKALRAPTTTEGDAMPSSEGPSEDETEDGERNAMTEREALEFLWGIIDDIDTTSDMAKGNDAAYRQRVERLQAKRWQTGITTDGYTLNFARLRGSGREEPEWAGLARYFGKDSDPDSVYSDASRQFWRLYWRRHKEERADVARPTEETDEPTTEGGEHGE